MSQDRGVPWVHREKFGFEKASLLVLDEIVDYDVADLLSNWRSAYHCY